MSLLSVLISGHNVLTLISGVATFGVMTFGNVFRLFVGNW